MSVYCKRNSIVWRSGISLKFLKWGLQDVRWSCFIGSRKLFEHILPHFIVMTRSLVVFLSSFCQNQYYCHFVNRPQLSKYIKLLQIKWTKTKMLVSQILGWDKTTKVYKFLHASRAFIVLYYLKLFPFAVYIFVAIRKA